MVVIISTVAEGVIEGHNLVFQYRIPVGSGQTAFSPCIIGICADLLPRAVVNPDDISLQILLKEEAIKYTGFIGTGSVFQANRRTGFIVEIIQQVFNSRQCPCLRNNLRAVKVIVVLNILLLQFPAAINSGGKSVPSNYLYCSKNFMAFHFLNIQDSSLRVF